MPWCGIIGRQHHHRQLGVAEDDQILRVDRLEQVGRAGHEVGFVGSVEPGLRPGRLDGIERPLRRGAPPASVVEGDDDAAIKLLERSKGRSGTEPPHSPRSKNFGKGVATTARAAGSRTRSRAIKSKASQP